jgi:energy-coupling factor transporter ATP-binding protein EcfA2/TPR repeat protein
MINENIPLNINFFQSANSEGSHIADDFVIRTKEYETIINEIRNYPMHGSVQHYLLLGRRGSGKSTLLKRIEYEINNDVALSTNLIPINLAEEQANIYRLMDLWEEIIKELKHLGIEINDSILNDFSGDSNAYNRELYAAIHDALKKTNKKIVLLLDNIDRIFENAKEDGALIREVLLNYDDIRIIGGSTRMSEHFWRYDLPFYNFFRVIALEALSNAEVKTLLLHWAKTYNLPGIEMFVKNKPGQLETIRILTDGLPRTLKFFINTIINRSQKDSYNYLKQIMDYVTPLYQERLNSLPAAHRKIILNLAFIWEATGVKQLAEVCKIESKLLSAHLKQLFQNGLVDKVETNKKNHLYRISERFFNLWLIFTQGSPGDKLKQKYLTIFLENWYDGKEIKEMALQHLLLLNGKTINADDVALFSKTLAHSKYITTKERDEIIDKTLELENLTPSLKESLPLKVKQIANECNIAIDLSDWAKATKLAENIEQDDGTKENLIGRIYFKQNDYQNAEKHLIISVKKGNNAALVGLGLLSDVQNKIDDSEKYYEEAINYGELFGHLGFATLYYTRGIEKEKALLHINMLDENYSTDNMDELYILSIKINIELWNGLFENIRNKVYNLLSKDFASKDFIIQELLIHQQLQLVNSLFEDANIGKKLQQEFLPLYYACQLLSGKNRDENITLKIPPEIKNTVEELIEDIKERQKLFYPE